MRTVRVNGLRSMLKVTDQMPNDIKRGVRAELRKVAEPVRAEATALFVGTVGKPGATKYGISVRAVGTVSVEQRLRRTTGLHPEFGALQMRRALLPALDHNEDNVVRAMDSVIADVERRWATA